MDGTGADAFRDELEELEGEKRTTDRRALRPRKRPDPHLPQDPGIPGGPPSPEPQREGSLESPDSPDDPRGIDAPGSKRTPPPTH